MLKNSLLGFYEPSFFEMHVCTDEHLDDLNKLSSKNLSVFFHEYVHFLQDTTTSFGLINLANAVNVQKALNSHINKQTSPFSVPVDWEATHPDVYNISLAFDMYWGESNSNFDSSSFVQGIGWADGCVQGFEKQIPWIYVDYIRSGKREKCCFGALAIMESMAYMLESMICDVVTSAPDYPYHFVELLAQYRYPEIKDDKILLILLCDIALNTYHPGKFLDETITRWARDKFLPKNYEEAYQYAEKYTFIDLNKVKYTFETLYEKSVREGIDAFAGYFTVPNFEPVKNWGVKLMQTALEIRQQRPYYWIEILQKPTKHERRMEFYSLFFSKLGTPLMINNLDECTFSAKNLYQGDINLMTTLRALKEIRNYLTKQGQQHCSLSQFCQKSINISQMDCTNPWKVFLRKDLHQLQLCPFCQLLKAWGIYKNQPQ